MTPKGKVKVEIKRRPPKKAPAYFNSPRCVNTSVAKEDLVRRKANKTPKINKRRLVFL